MSWDPDEIPGHTSWLIKENRPRALHEYVGHWKDDDTIEVMLGEIAKDLHYKQFTEFIAESKSLRESNLNDYLKKFIVKIKNATMKHKEKNLIFMSSDVNFGIMQTKDE